MGKIVANLPELAAAANSITGYIEEFREQKGQVMQASQALSEGWEGSAAQTYLDTMNEMAAWMEQMASVLDSYPEALNEIKSKYETADQEGAHVFGR